MARDDDGTYRITAEEFAAAAAGEDPEALWLLAEDGTTSVVPSANPNEYGHGWPRYLGRVGHIHQHLARRGGDAAAVVDEINLRMLPRLLAH